MTVTQNGVVLTYVDSLDMLEDCVRRGGYNTVKIVTEWGVKGGWTPQARKTLAQMVPNVIVRTTTGDPNYKGFGPNLYVDPNRTRNEIAPWYATRQDIMIELGNEPNIEGVVSDLAIFEWAYNLRCSAQVCRAEFPNAKIIAPAMVMYRPKAARFLEIAAPIYNEIFNGRPLFDFIAIHAYEHFGFEAGHKSYTGHLVESVKAYVKLFPAKDWYITEYGINDPATSAAAKGHRYAAMLAAADNRIKGAVYYHLNAKTDLHPEYVIYPRGDAALHAKRFV